MKKLDRVAFVLKLLPGGHENDYEKRHNPIWPELSELFKKHGVANYSIFLNEENLDLFGYAEVESIEQWEAIADTGVCRRWWEHMSDIMESNEDGSPVAKPLKEVFHHEVQ